MDVGPHRPQLVQRRDHAVADGPVGLEQTRDQRLLRFRTADPQQHRRQLTPHFDGTSSDRNACDNGVTTAIAKPGQRVGGILGQLRAAERDHQRQGELLAAHPVRGTHRLAGHLEVLVGNQRRQQIEQECRVVHRSDEPRRLGAVAPPLDAGGPGHGLDHEPRGIEILRPPRGGEKRGRSRADGEVLEIAQLLNLPQRIDARLA